MHWMISWAAEAFKFSPWKVWRRPLGLSLCITTNTFSENILSKFEAQKIVCSVYVGLLICIPALSEPPTKNILNPYTARYFIRKFASQATNRYRLDCHIGMALFKTIFAAAFRGGNTPFHMPPSNSTLSMLRKKIGRVLNMNGSVTVFLPVRNDRQVRVWPCSRNIKKFGGMK